MHIGIDIGSTATKVAVFNGDQLSTFIQPTGWSGAETAEAVKSHLESQGVDFNQAKVVATGYGRVSVPYAGKMITEITCHGKGATYLFEGEGTIIDIGGQDTKVIQMKDHRVEDFRMNDKCSAGTGKFIEIMANRLGVTISEMTKLASEGSGLRISSMCTVFAESEVISLIGRGESKADIADAIIESVLDKVMSLLLKQNSYPPYYLTGGLCEEEYILTRLSEKLGHPVQSKPEARFAGAIGAALLSAKL